jgi:hypothetical protein
MSLLERSPNHTGDVSRIPNTIETCLIVASVTMLLVYIDANDAKAVQYCCVSKETQQYCTIPLLRDRAPTSRSQGNLTHVTVFSTTIVTGIYL